MKTKTFQCVVKIEVAEDIIEKYPNFKFNYDNTEQFAKSVLKLLEEKKLEEFGYEITVHQVGEVI